jgi:hypothetical protein
LASGSEGTSTLDLILTVRKPLTKGKESRQAVNSVRLDGIVNETVSEIDVRDRFNPSHIYLTVLKRAFEEGLPVDSLHLSDILKSLKDRGFQVNTKSGILEAA